MARPGSAAAGTADGGRDLLDGWQRTSRASCRATRRRKRVDSNEGRQCDSRCAGSGGEDRAGITVYSSSRSWRERGARGGIGSQGFHLATVGMDAVPALTSAAVTVRLGGFITPTIFVGVEGAGATSSTFGLRKDFVFSSAIVQWYPGNGSLFTTSGIGGAFHHQKIEETFYTNEGTLKALGISLGAGYEWRLTNRLALTPFVEYHTSVGGMKGYSYSFCSCNDPDLRISLLSVGVGLAFWATSAGR